MTTTLTSARPLTLSTPGTAATRKTTASAPLTCPPDRLADAPSARCHHARVLRHGRPGRRPATPAASAARARDSTTPRPATRVPARALVAPARDRRVRVAPVPRRRPRHRLRKTSLSRTNRGLRPAAAALPRVARAAAGSPVLRLAPPAQVASPKVRPLAGRGGRTRGTDKSPTTDSVPIPGTRPTVMPSGGRSAPAGPAGPAARAPQAAETADGTLQDSPADSSMADSSMADASLAPPRTHLTSTVQSSTTRNSTDPASTDPASTDPASTDPASTGLANPRPGRGRTPRMRSRRESQVATGTRTRARVSTRPAGTRTREMAGTDPALGRWDQDRWDQDRWDRDEAGQGGLARVLASSTLDIRALARTGQRSRAPGNTVPGRRAPDRDRAVLVASHPKDSPTRTAGPADSATRPAAGSIQAPARPGRGTGRAAPSSSSATARCPTRRQAPRDPSPRSRPTTSARSPATCGCCVPKRGLTTPTWRRSRTTRCGR